MPSTFTWVTAAPASDESSTRRSALPSVRPKPRSSGSTWKRPKSSDEWRASTFATVFSTKGGPPRGPVAAQEPGRADVRAGRYAARPNGPLARIELDDQLFVDGNFDFIATGQVDDPTAHVGDVELEPGRRRLPGQAVLDDLEVFELAGLRRHRDDVVRLHQRRRDVRAAAIEREVAVPDQLTGLL